MTFRREDHDAELDTSEHACDANYQIESCRSDEQTIGNREGGNCGSAMGIEDILTELHRKDRTSGDIDKG